MELQSERHGEVLVLKIAGERLSADTAQRFKADVANLLEDAVKRVVFDMSSVKFVDSTGVGAVISVLKMLGPSGQLAIAGLSDSAAYVFQLTHMYKVMLFFTTTSEAISALADHGSPRRP
jgi:anti-sigma B factor antagonist